jgi:hypothetical protein
MMQFHLLASSGTVRFFKRWDFTGNFTTVDLVAASTNALNGALLCRLPITTRTSPSSKSSCWPSWDRPRGARTSTSPAG